jgi:NADH dehydrogenase
MFLVAGGTGFVGSAIVTELLNRGEAVAVLGRSQEKIKQRWGDRVEARAADVSRPETLASAFTGIDTAINAVQFPTSPIEVPRKGWTFEEVDYKGTRSQVDAAKAAGVRRFLYISGAGAASGAEKHWFRYKWMAEQHLQQSGLEWTVVRPTWVFGKGDRALNRLIGFSNFLPFVPMFGDGKQGMQPVFIDDVGRVVADAATSPETAGEVLELGGPQVLSMNEVLQTALDVMGRKRIILHQPVFVGKLAGTLAGVLPTPPLSADAVDFINSPAVADNVNLARLLHPQLTLLRDGLETYLGR